MRTIELSPPERVAIALALALLLLQALAPGESLEYRRSALAGQPWRALTAHLVHVNWPHALINAAALRIVARLYAPDFDTRRQFVALLVSALAISAALAGLYPAIEWYRVLSGAVHGLFFAGAAKWLLAERPRTLRRLWIPAALFAGGWIKVVEDSTGAHAPAFRAAAERAVRQWAFEPAWLAGTVPGNDLDATD